MWAALRMVPHITTGYAVNLYENWTSQHAYRNSWYAWKRVSGNLKTYLQEARIHLHLYHEHSCVHAWCHLYYHRAASAKNTKNEISKN